jgi:hypothetical protein
MRERELFIIFDRESRKFATRKSFTSDFSECRVYKERFHAENAVNHKFLRYKDTLCIVPLKMVLDPCDEFAAVLGHGSI